MLVLHFDPYLRGGQIEFSIRYRTLQISCRCGSGKSQKPTHDSSGRPRIPDAAQQRSTAFGC